MVALTLVCSASAHAQQFDFQARDASDAGIGVEAYAAETRFTDDQGRWVEFSWASVDDYGINGLFTLSDSEGTTREYDATVTQLSTVKDSADWQPWYDTVINQVNAAHEVAATVYGDLLSGGATFFSALSSGSLLPGIDALRDAYGLVGDIQTQVIELFALPTMIFLVAQQVMAIIAVCLGIFLALIIILIIMRKYAWPVLTAASVVVPAVNSARSGGRSTTAARSSRSSHRRNYQRRRR